MVTVSSIIASVYDYTLILAVQEYLGIMPEIMPCTSISMLSGVYRWLQLVVLLPVCTIIHLASVD